MMSQSSASLFHWENHAHVQKSYAGLPAYPLASLPNESNSSNYYTETDSSILYPKFQACDTLPKVFQCALIL